MNDGNLKIQKNNFIEISKKLISMYLKRQNIENCGLNKFFESIIWCNLYEVSFWVTFNQNVICYEYLFGKPLICSSKYIHWRENKHMLRQQKPEFQTMLCDAKLNVNEQWSDMKFARSVRKPIPHLVTIYNWIYYQYLWLRLMFNEVGLSSTMSTISKMNSVLVDKSI